MYSKEHLIFLKKRKRKKAFICISQIIIFFIFIAIWQILANYNLINTFIFSSPQKIINTIISLYNSNKLFSNIWITVYETLISFALSTLLGIIIATLLWWNKTLQKIIEPYLTILNSLPKVALGPMIIIWFGAGIKSIIFMSLLISLILTIINVYEGFNNTDINKIKLMKSFKCKKYQLYFKLILPSNISTIINVLKINISMCLIGLLPPVGENFIV